MPNTEVKLSSAENTWMETSWEDREVLALVYSPIAQSVERVTVNHDVVGSSPTWGAIKRQTSIRMSVFLCFVIIQQVGREQGGDRITCVTVRLEVATNNLNGCWLARGCLLQRRPLASQPLALQDELGFLPSTKPFLQLRCLLGEPRKWKTGFIPVFYFFRFNEWAWKKR